MNNLLKLATKELKSNKKMVFSILLSIILVSILINSITTLALSYQDYVVNLCRNKGNWEAQFIQIPYDKLTVLESDERIKEISLIEDLGIFSYNDNSQELLHIKAYDSNTMKNMPILLKEGNLPQSSNEILVNESTLLQIDDSISILLDEKEYVFHVTGILESTDFDEFNTKTFVKTNGAITYLNKDSLTPNSYLTASIVCQDISQIYDCTNDIQSQLNSLNSTPQILYNTELLSYAGNAKSDSTFQTNLILTVSVFIGIVSVASISLIYTIFHIFTQERKRYIAKLSSVGATKKQIAMIYFFEIIILTCIAIPVGILLSFGLVSLLLHVFDNLFTLIQSNISTTLIQNSISLQMVFSWYSIIFSILLIVIIVFFSVLFPIIQISKVSILNTLRENTYYKVTKHFTQVPKWLSKLFKIEGILAYKNMKRKKSHYITMVMSLTISIILFISIYGYIYNLSNYNQYEQHNYNYTLNLADYSPEHKAQEELIEIKKVLQNSGFIEEIHSYANLNPLYLVLDNSKLNDMLKFVDSKMNLLNNSFNKVNEHTSQLSCLVTTLDDATYQDYLSQIDSSLSLSNNECILINYSNAQNKYYDSVCLTNYQIGENLILNTQDINDEKNQEVLDNLSSLVGDSNRQIENKQISLSIKAITGRVPTCLPSFTLTDIYLIVNKDTFSQLFLETVGAEFSDFTNFYIQTSKPNELDELVYSLKAKYENAPIVIESSNLSASQQIEKNEILIKEILLYSFLVFIFVLTIITVLNIVFSSLSMRKTEFAELKAIGMSNRQMNKILFLEGLFYGTISLIIGILISIGILYFLYHTMINTQVYRFSIDLISIFISIILIYAVIFISILYANKKLYKEDIATIIKTNIT